MKINKLFFTLPLSLIALSATYWFYQANQMSSETKNLAVQPDYWMEQVTVTKFDEEGRLHSQLATPKLVHYRYEDTAHLTQPSLLFYDKETIPWEINAKYGQTKSGSETIFLQDHVFIHHKGNATHRPTTLLTQTLTIYPKSKQAHTQASVTILQPGMTIHSVGMHADLEKNTVNFLSKAQGFYANQG